MIKHIDRGKNQHRTAAIVACLFFCLLFASFTTACQPEKAAVVLTPIPVEQTATDDMLTSEQLEPSPDPVEEIFSDMHWKTEEDLYGGLTEAPFVYPVSDPHITKEPETLNGDVRILVDADVMIPQAAGYGIRQCDKSGFTLEDYQRLTDILLPNAKWVSDQSGGGVYPDGTLDLANVDLSETATFITEQDGERCTVMIGGDQHIFSFDRGYGIVYREGFLVGDAEMEQEFGEIIREPIPLTLEEAQTKADEMLAQLNIRNWTLDSAERACLFDMDNTDIVLSHGWDFVYMLSNGGLPVHYYGGVTGTPRDPLDYCGADAGWLWVYVDEKGISRVYWINRYQPGYPTYSNVQIIRIEDVIALAKERIGRIYSQEYNVPFDIEIYAIRLSSMLLAYSDETVWGVYDNEQRDMTHMVPTWDISCRVISPNGDPEYFTLPFCAIDGGAITMRN